MKIALTSSGETLSAPLSERFGRAPKIVVIDTESSSIEVEDNQAGMAAPRGAGIQAAERIARLGVKCLVTGHCGPKAFRVLRAAGIHVFTAGSTTVGEAAQALQEGRLTPLEAADVDGAWAQ